MYFTSFEDAFLALSEAHFLNHAISSDIADAGDATANVIVAALIDDVA